MRLGFVCLAVSAAVVAAFWVWLGLPVAMPHTPLGPGEKLYCLSYAPFRDGQTPFDPAMRIAPAQIDDDLTRLSKITDCVRTYSVELGQDQVAAIAKRHGMTLFQGIWLGVNPEKNRAEIETAVSIANEYPDVVRALVVGNEVLLRGDMAADDLAATIRAVKARVKVPVTYADVWEYWLKNPQVGAATDFVTIHILPYWEDFPDRRGAGGRACRRDPPRRGRGACPARKSSSARSAGRARAACARARCRRRPIRRASSRTCWRSPSRNTTASTSSRPSTSRGSARSRAPSAAIGACSMPRRATTNSSGARRCPIIRCWKWQAAGGVAFAVLIFAAAFVARRGDVAPAMWLAVTANAIAGGALHRLEHRRRAAAEFRRRRLLRSVALAAIALSVPPLVSAATMRGTAVPPFARVIGPRAKRASDPLALAAGALLIATMLLALQSALGLVFDPRYRDFPFAPLTAAVVPFVTHHGGETRERRARRGGIRRCRAAGALGALHRDQREFQQLAVAVAVRGLCRARRHSGTGARRAKLRTSSPAASADS